MAKLSKCILFLIFVYLLVQGNLAFDATKQALNFWFNRLVPSLFVSMVLIQICLDYHLFSNIPVLSSLFEKIFNTNRAGVSLILSSLFLGAPSGAVLVNQKAEKKQLTSTAAKRIITCLSLPTPAFTIITCGSVLLKHKTLGFILWIIEIGLCLLFLGLWQKDRIELKDDPQTVYFFPSFKAAVKNSGITLFYIGGYLMMFLTLFNLFTHSFPYEIKEFLKAAGEFSLGCQSIGTSFLPLSLQFACMAAVLGFNGFCVHLQIFSMSEESHLNYGLFFILRIIQALLGFLLALILFSLLQ